MKRSAYTRPNRLFPNRSRSLLLLLLPTITTVLSLSSHGNAASAVTPPKPLPHEAPRWPDGSAGPHRLVVPLLVSIDASGTVTNAAPEVPGDPAFDTAAVRAVMSWKFSPAIRSGTPVPSKIRFPVFFDRPTQVAKATPNRNSTSTVTPRQHDEATPPTAREKTSTRLSSTKASTPPSSIGERTANPSSTKTPVDVWVTGRAPSRSASQVVRNRDVLMAAPHRDGSDLLKVIPGVVLSQHGGRGKAQQLFVRGFDAVHGQDVEFWVGGAPVNSVSNVHGQGYAHMHFIIPEVVRQVDASMGPYDPRQGDFGTAATVRFHLGVKHPGTTFKVSYGSFDSRRFLLMYHPEGIPEQTFGAAEWQSTDGFGPSRASSHISAMAQAVTRLSPKLRLRTLVTGFAGRFQSAGVVPLDDILSHKINRYAVLATGQGGSGSHLQVVSSLATRCQARWHFTPFLIRETLRLRQNFTGYLEDRLHGDSTQQGNDASTLGFTTSYRKPVSWISKRDTLTVGGRTRYDHIDQFQDRIDEGSGTPVKPWVDATIDALNVAGYVDAALHPMRRVVLRGGLRLDGFWFQVDDRVGKHGVVHKTSQGSQLQKRGTLDVAIVRGLHGLLSYGEGVRSPQARSLQDGEPQPFTRVRAAEVGLRFKHHETLRVSASGFQSWLSDDLVFDHVTGRNERTPATTRQGIALDMVVHAPGPMVAAIGATYTRAWFTEDGPSGLERGSLVPYVPQVVVRSDYAVRPKLGRLLGSSLWGRIGSGATLLHRRPLRFSEWGHDMMLWDASIALQTDHASLALKAFNLLDAAWYDGEFVYASNFDQRAAPHLVPRRHVTVGSPRVLMLTLTLHDSPGDSS